MTYRELIEKSFSMLYDSPERPNLGMLYSSKTEALREGFIWDGWWIQNSYGFTLGAIPFLGGFWRDTLRKSYDMFWDRIGDGKRIGMDSGIPNERWACYNLCAPDGSLGDAATHEGIIYRQGDGDFNLYDWFYEATAAGVVVTCEMLLFSRDSEQLEKYIPLMKRSLDFIEKTRDDSGLFLVGMCCNLLAPSFGGAYNKETEQYEKSYLTGLAVTYSAALERYIEVLKLAGMESDEYRKRLDMTLKVLPLLLNEDGSFCKSMEQNGTRHGVWGAEQYGYFETSPNVDAIALGVVDSIRGEQIYKALAAVDGLRKYGIVCVNYPHLDDTYKNYSMHSTQPDLLGRLSGDWVDGGCWGTVEGRAILSYLRLGKYEDAFRAAEVYMKWAEEYRQDAPMSQWGENTHNPWAAENAPGQYDSCRPVAVMVDNFAAATCLLRGLFEYRANAEALILTPHIPDEIGSYRQEYPVFFGNTEIYIAYEPGDGARRVYLDETEITSDCADIVIDAAKLSGKAYVTVTIREDGGAGPIMMKPRSIDLKKSLEELPDTLADIFVSAKNDLLDSGDSGRSYAVYRACEAAAARRQLPFIEHGLRPMTEEKKREIIKLYDDTVIMLAGTLWKKN